MFNTRTIIHIISSPLIRTTKFKQNIQLFFFIAVLEEHYRFK